MKHMKLHERFFGGRGWPQVIATTQWLAIVRVKALLGC
jgi:hypothetical protein